MKYLVLLGRILYSGIFMLAAGEHFLPQAVVYAPAKGVPYANWLMPISGVLATLGGISIAFGYKAKAVHG